MKRWSRGTWVTLLMAILAAAPAGAATLKFGVPANPVKLDPAKQNIGEEYLPGFLIFNGLTTKDRSMAVQPDLAERWESSADLLTWTFYLRKGVRFHHGRELDSEDVLSSLKRVLDPATGSPARVNLQVIDKMEAVDKHTVRFRLTIPYAGFADIFTERQAKIVPRDRVETLMTQPIGTGPFKFKEFIPGDHLTLVKNPDYWEKGLPLLDEIVMRIIPESSVAMTALEAGDIQLYWNAPLEALERLKRNAALVVDEVPTTSWDAVMMRNDQPPFNDVRVRQALFHSLDKEQLAKAAVFGHGSVTHTPIPPGHPFFNKGLKSLPRDIGKAKQLLAQAGHPNGLDLKLYIPEGRPTRERLGIAVKELATPAGFRIELQRVPWDKFVADIEGKAPFFIDGFFSRPTVDTSIYPWYHSTGSWNPRTWHYKNARVDELLDQARRTLSDQEAKKLYDEFQKIIVEEGPSLVAYVLTHVTAYPKQLKGFRSHPMMWLDLKRASIEK